MLSIRSATNELDRLEDLLRVAADVHAQGIRSAADYVVEIEPGSAREFREHLRALQRQVIAAGTVEDWQTVQANFRGELRAYRDKATAELERLHNEIRAAGKAMQEFAHAVTLSDADHEAKLKENLGALDSISRSGDLDGIRAGIQGVTHSISESIDVMQRSHQAAVAQLRDEIRVLHEEVDRARSAEWTNAATGFWNRRKLDARIAELIATDRPFCLMLVRVRNLPQIAAQHPKALVNVCVKSLLQRFRGIVGSEALTGHWDESSFAAVLEIAASVALDLSGAAAQRLSGTYTVQEKGVSHNIALLAVAGVIERPTGIDEATYQRKLRQMLETLAWG